MRFTSITIENFKNVEYGRIDLSNPRIEGGPSILALYGQNGSGKSALVDTLVIFKCLLTAKQIPSRFAYYITTGTERAKICYELEGHALFATGLDENGQTVKEKRAFTAQYEIEFGRNDLGLQTETEEAKQDRLLLEEEYKKPITKNGIKILSEVLKCRWNDRGRMRTLFLSDNKRTIRPSSFTKLLVMSEYFPSYSPFEIAEWAIQSKRICHDWGLSILARPMLGPVLSPEVKTFGEVFKIEGTDLQHMFESLRKFARNRLFVVGTRESESIESGKLAFFFNGEIVDFTAAMLWVDNRAHYHSVDSSDDEQIKREMVSRYEDAVSRFGIDKIAASEGVVFVSTDPDNPTRLPFVSRKAVQATLLSINIILERMVPGLTLSLHVEEIPDSMDVNASIMACRPSSTLPLSCESRGIQKIVSIAWLLVNVYNENGFTAVIDELDSGVFEYLLGELLELIAEEGQGQLVFTSHNLRPLEVLDKGYIAFSTANPKNRYIRLKSVKSTNNLRDFYYRSILLGGQDEDIYDPSTEGDLRMAFIKAGMLANDTHDEFKDIEQLSSLVLDDKQGE